MRQTIVTTILEDFKKMDRDTQRRYLQFFEKYCASHFNRPERDVVYESELDNNCKENGFYDTLAPHRINIFYNNNPLGILMTVFHEGYHALIDDFFNERTNKLRAMSQIDRTRFYFEYIHTLEIAQRTMGQYRDEICLSKYEEILTRKETALNILTALMVASETDEDINQNLRYYQKILHSAFLTNKHITAIDTLLQNNFDNILSQLMTEYNDQLCNLKSYINTQSYKINDKENLKLENMYEKGIQLYTQAIEKQNNGLDYKPLKREIVKDFKDMSYEMINQY